MYRNFILNRDLGVIFAYVPKVACTNWKSLMRRMNGADDWLDSALAHDRTRSGLTYLDPTDDLPVILSEGVRRFAMVRDPYSRALSGFLNKVESNLPPRPVGDDDTHWDIIVRDIDSFRRTQLDPAAHLEIDFEVFLLWLRDSGSWFARDEHWAPQHILLAQPDVSFDYIGKFEEVDTEASIILSKMGSDATFPSQKAVKFAPTNAKDRLNTYMNPTVESLVEELFAPDFAYFGYATRSGQDVTRQSDVKSLQTSLARHNTSGFLTVARPYTYENILQNQYKLLGLHTQPKDEFADYLAARTGLGPLLDAIDKSNNPQGGVSILDVGAYMGMFALAGGLSARDQGLTAALHCMEPNPAFDTAISANLKLCGFEGLITLAALAPDRGEKRLIFPANQQAAARARGPQETMAAGETELRVNSLTLADILENSPTIGLVKLSLKGLEAACFRPIANDANRLRNVFIITYSDWQQSVEIAGQQFADWLFDNFRVSVIGKWLNWREFEILEAADALRALAPEREVGLLLTPLDALPAEDIEAIGGRFRETETAAP